MKNQVLTGILVLLHFTMISQNFEGTITYKIEAINPNPKMIPDSLWQSNIKEVFGERGYMLQKYFYSKENYISEIATNVQSGYQAYNPKDGLLYSWQEGSDTAITVDSRKYVDQVTEVIRLNEIDTILNVACKSLKIKSKLGEMTLWYNSSYFKLDPNLYKGHKYGHWDRILEEIKCLPLKIEQKGLMTHIIQTAIDYKEEKINPEKFKLPKFKEIIANPIN